MIRKFVFPLALLGAVSSSLPQSISRAEDLFGVVPLAAPVVSEKPLNDLFSRQWVKLSDSGKIDGQLIELVSEEKKPLAGLPVALVREGKIVTSTTAGNDGKFSFSGVRPGLYSLVSRTNETIAAFALQVLDGKDASHLPSSIEVRAIRSVGDKVKEIVRAQVVPGMVSRSDTTAAISIDPLANERRFAMSHVVKLDENGNLQGHLAKSGVSASASRIEGMTVFVLKNGVEVARTEVDTDGQFVVKGIEQGVYGFIAAGSGSFVATSFQIVNPALVNNNNLTADGGRLVSMNMQDCCPAMNCEVIESCEISACEPSVCETVVQQAPIVESSCCDAVPVEGCGCGQAPTCGGGCGGGGWGGGGYGGGGSGGGGGGLFGGGGGGGFGGILGLAGLAGVAAVVANNNDDNNNGNVNLNQPPITVSRITP